MNYWLGSGVDAYEIERTIYCPTCDDEMDNISCWVEGTIGLGTCPICQTEVEFEVEE
jgi:transcription elongation factor Elf1